MDGDTKWKNVIKYKNDSIWDTKNLLLLREGGERERGRERMNYAIKMQEKS